MQKNLMHLISGDVATLREWEDAFSSMDIETWGYPENYKGNFSDWIKVGKLVEVELVNGEWEAISC